MGGFECQQPVELLARVAQVNALPIEYGAQGTVAKTMIYNYVSGVNAYIKAALANPVKSLRNE